MDHIETVGHTYQDDLAEIRQHLDWVGPFRASALMKFFIMRRNLLIGPH